MEKNELLNWKRRLGSLAMVGVILGTAGCIKEESNSKNSSRIENFGYCIVVEENGEKEKRYYNKNVYLLYDKETYDLTIWIHTAEGHLVLPNTNSFELRLFNHENLKDYTYDEVKPVTYDEYYYKLNNSYIVNLSKARDYIDDHISKSFYTLDEINDLTLQIATSLKNNNASRVRSKYY